ncbi:MAG: hypothetical protein QM719_10585 [Thermomonas sp.]
MPDKDEIRIRRTTNLYDLLDDGIANNSDIGELIHREDEVAKQRSGQAMPECRSVPKSPAISRKARSWFGIILGILVSIAGAETALHPVAMEVWHDRAKYLPSFWEYVDIERARGYGICVAIFGLLLLAYSLIKMPVADKKSQD